MEIKKEFKPSIKVDFSKIKFYEIPYPFFAEWLYLVLEISKIIQPGFQIDIPKKRLDWFNSPDQQVFEPASGVYYTLRTASAILKNGDYSIQIVAQYGYEIVPGQFISVKSNVTNGGVSSKSLMKDNTINFEIKLEEFQLAAVEEAFYIFQ